MSTANRPNRKNSDAVIIRLNSVGLSLQSIADRLHCHPTSITLRLKSLKIPTADTRRSFMEDIYASAPEGFLDEVADHLQSAGFSSIKDYVKDLMFKDMASRRPAPAPVAAESNFQSVAA